MKKILAFLIALSLTLTMLLSLSSCYDTSYDSGYNNGQIGGDNEEDGTDGDELKEDTDNSDGGSTDSGSTDGGSTDSGSTDGGSTDGGSTDGGSTDGGSTDGGSTDGGSTDGGSTDTGNDGKCENGHVDSDNDNYCDRCEYYLIVVIDFYSFNDLHGKFCDTDTQPGVDEIGTYLENQNDDYSVLISAGDMWQGGAESNLSKGEIIVEWMNLLGFVSMTLGNHEFDWGEDVIRDNLNIADFPFLAINVYSNSTNKLADYCTPSVMIERGGVQIGIIGAVGDCYTSIASEMRSGFSLKTGSELTSLVKAEATRLRNAGADFIVYSLHDDASGYDTVLSNGYVDLVFEGHTHTSYVNQDSYGVYHLQGGGENEGFSHVEISIHLLSGKSSVRRAEEVQSSRYGNLADHSETEALEVRFADVISMANTPLGIVSRTYSDSEIEDFVARLYYEAGVERWGSKYDIELGGGFLRTRSPYNLTSGTKTYGDLLNIFPFDNRLMLCSIKGSTLKSKFIETDNTDYHIYRESTSAVSSSRTYYVIVDSYTATYKYNYLTIIEEYDLTTFARDLLADAISEGRL